MSGASLIRNASSIRGNRPVLPFLAVATGIATFSVMDAAMKSASIDAGVYNAMLLRAAIGTVMMAPVWLLAGGNWPGYATLRLHALRSFAVACMAMLFFWALVRMPMAEAMALSFIAPLIALYLAAVILGERIRPAAIAASLCGLGGVIVIASARFGEEGSLAASGPAILAVLGSAVFYAWNLILQKQQALVARPTEVALFQNMFVGLLLLPAAPWLAAVPTPDTIGDIAVAAALASISLMLLSWGYGRAEAQALVPLEYSGFIWAALAGWIWFGEAVTAATVAGTVLIVIGCVVGTRRQRPEGIAPQQAPSVP
jgi:S-adenosylmethionine uptake transporter